MLASCVCLGSATPAQAIGFSGTFAPSTWLLINTNPAQTLNSTGTGVNGTYTCGTTNNVACIEQITSTGVDVVGSFSGDTGGGTSATSRSTSLVLANTEPAYRVSFDWAFASASSESGSLTAYYKVGINSEVLLATWPGSGSAISGNVSNIEIADGSSIQFIVKTSTNTGAEGVLSISNFNATSSAVPGPLPAAGAATAFGYSRCLRRRIKGEVPVGCGKSSRSSDPSSYLLLSPASQQVLPLSFSYSPQQHKGFRFAASFSLSAPTAGDSVSVHSRADGDIL